MAYVDNNATAWGEVEVKFGTPGAGNTMATTLKTLGIIDAENFLVETKDLMMSLSPDSSISQISESNALLAFLTVHFTL